MKIDAIKKDQKSVSKILHSYNEKETSNAELEAGNYWILSLLGGLSIGIIWLVSTLTN